MTFPLATAGAEDAQAEETSTKQTNLFMFLTSVPRNLLEKCL
jgi:hypothetical protein